MNPQTIEKLYNCVVFRHKTQQELIKTQTLLEEYGKQDFTIGGLGAMQRLESRILDLQNDLIRVNMQIRIHELELGLNDNKVVEEATRIANGGEV